MAPEWSLGWATELDPEAELAAEPDAELALEAELA